MNFWARQTAQLGLFACALAAGACAADKHPARGVAERPVPDAGRAGAPQTQHDNANGRVGHNDPRLQCPTLMPCQSKPLTSSDVLVAAADVGPDTRFVAIAGRVILAERGKAAEPIAIEVASYSRMFEVLEYPPTQLVNPKAIAIDGYYSETYSLLCDDDACNVFSSSVNHPLEPVASISAKAGTLTGIVAEECAAARYQFCVFGDGLFCFDGNTWTTEIESAPLQHISAVAIDTAVDACRPILAAGTHGKLWQYEDGWKTLDTETTVDLTTVSALRGRFTAAGEGIVIEGDPFGWISCPIEGLVPQKLLRLSSRHCSALTGPNGALATDDGAQARGFDTRLLGITTQGQLILSSGGCSGSETWECDQRSVPDVDVENSTVCPEQDALQLSSSLLTAWFFCIIE